MVEKGKEGHPTNPKRKGGRGGAHKDGSCSRTAATEKGDSQSTDDDNNGDDYCGIFRPAWVLGPVQTMRPPTLCLSGPFTTQSYPPGYAGSSFRTLRVGHT
jgi:hypothetical protein